MTAEETYKLAAQITNGTIDPNWVLVCLMAGFSVLLIRILNRIEKKLEEHDTKLQNHEVRLTVIEKE
jgi:hypothetical protein